MGKGKRAEGQESLHTAGGSAGYLRSATTTGSITTTQFLHTLRATTHLLQPKQQFVVTHQHTILWEREKLDRSLTDQHVSTLCFY